MNLVKCVVFSRASQMTQVKNVPTVQEMQGMWVQSLGRKDPLEEGMAAHSSVLAWRIPWAEETDKPRSIELRRVGSNGTCTHVVFSHM